jgi:hypothetical protein
MARALPVANKVESSDFCVSNKDVETPLVNFELSNDMK